MERITIEGNTATVTVNPAVYDIDSVYAAGFVFTDRACVVLDGDPATGIEVRLTPLTEKSPFDVSGEFFNELVHHQYYRRKAEKTRNIRQAFMKRILITNDPSLIDENIYPEGS